jgi:hypothetical protein
MKMSKTNVCMKQWEATFDALNKTLLPKLVMVSIDRFSGDGGGPVEHLESIMIAFESMKSQGLPVVVINGRGQLLHKFPGETAVEFAEVIGVPSFDAVIYISDAAGRVDVTGPGAAALSAAMGSATQA